MIKKYDSKITLVQRSNHKETGDDISLAMDITPGNEARILHELEIIVCQVKETLNQLARKQKTWDQKEENPVAQQEQESSTHSNDQRLQEKEQSQKIVKTNKQYIISYPPGSTRCLDTGKEARNCDIADAMVAALRVGDDITMPNDWKVQVIDL